MLKRTSPRKWVFRQAVYLSPNTVRVGGREVKLTSIGVKHGQANMIPLGRRVSRVLEKHLAGEKGLILAESNDKSLLPKRILGKANLEKRPMDESAITDYVLGKGVGKAASKSKLLFAATMGAMFGVVLSGQTKRIIGDALFEPRVIHSLPEKYPSAKRNKLGGQMNLVRKLMGVSEKEFLAGYKLLVTARSLLMAANSMKYIAEAKVSSASIVTGTGHTTEIYKFISRPKLAVRYANKLLRNLPYNSESYLVVDALEKAKRVFEKQSAAN